MEKRRNVFIRLYDALDNLYSGMIDGLIEKLTLSEREIAIAEGKVIEFSKIKRKKG